jgi:hypothetical protein
MSNAILYRMPAGFAGDVTRKADGTIEPNILGADCAFGAAVEMSAGKIIPYAGGTLYGFLVRSYPTQGGPTGLTAAGKLPSGSACDVLRRGYISAVLARGAAAKGAPAYLRITAATGKAVGDLEAAADVGALSIAGAATAGNAGNGTIGTLAVTSKAKLGAHSVIMTAATAFSVKDPDGLVMGTGAAGTAFSAGGVTFTITAGGTPMVAGDSFTVTVTKAADGNVALPATFTGPADSDGNVELAYNI